MTGFLLVCVGAAVGAPTRYLTDRLVQSRHDTVVPWGTFTVNLVGSFLFGVLAGISQSIPVPAGAVLAVGTGFCGALTTYSTFSYESFRLFEAGARFYALLNVAASLAGGLGAIVLGIAAGQIVT